MRAQFLKLAGVKTDKEFYAKFPTEEAFMAKYGAKLKKAQFGVNFASAINPNYEQLMKSPNLNTVGYNPIKVDPKLGKEISQRSDMLNREPIKEPFDFAGAIGAAGGLVQGIQAIGDQKKAYKQTKQNRMVSDVALQASRVQPDLPENRYDRPEDYEMTGEELFPIYGRGSNVLAKHGKKMYATGGAMPFGEMLSSGGGDALSGVARGAFDNNAGYQMGAGVGNALKMIPGVGPVAGALAAPVLGTIGGVLDNAFGTAGKLKREQRRFSTNMDNMFFNQIGGASQNTFGSFLEYGGKMAMGGELQAMEGEMEPISQNPHIPGGGETVMFKGPSHAQGGMDVGYNGNMVEVEGGEPATKMPDSQTGEDTVTVFGNLPIPKSFSEIDPASKNKKFKNYAKHLSLQEAKYTKLIDSASKKLIDLDETDSFDRIKKNSLEQVIKGNDMKLAEVAQKKMAASELQDSINQASQMYNLDATALAQGKMKPMKKSDMQMAKYGKTLYAEDGVTTDPKKPIVFTSEAKAKEAGFKKNSDGEWIRKTKDGTEQTTEIVKGGSKTINTTKSAGKVIKAYENQMSNEAWKEYKKNETPEQLHKRRLREQAEGYREGYNMDTEQTIVEPDTERIIEATPPEFEYATINSPEIEPIEYKRNKMMDAYNAVLPFIRPSNAEPLDGRQLYGEMYAMASNQLEPVQAQGYQPLLDVPYDISLQDQMNEVTASSRAASRLAGYNPAFQSNVAAQEQMNKSKILGEQFRMNQGMKDRVYSGNRATLNDARVKNLNINDQQYQRQAQALSNTKEVNQLALNSMSDKYLKNNLENRTLQTMENMYNYRYDRRGRAINMNPLFQPEPPQVGAMAGQEPYEVRDADGNIKYFQLGPTSQQNLNKAGKTNDYVGSVARNGSIIKSFKSL